MFVVSEKHSQNAVWRRHHQQCGFTGKTELCEPAALVCNVCFLKERGGGRAFDGISVCV